MSRTRASEGMRHSRQCKEACTRRNGALLSQSPSSPLCAQCIVLCVLWCLFAAKPPLCRHTTEGILTVQWGGGGQVCQGTIATGTISEGDNSATSINPEACCHFRVGTFKIRGNTAFQCNPSHTTTARSKRTHPCPFPPPGTPLPRF